MSIVIEGNSSFIPEATFRPKIERCLSLLRENASSYYTWLDRYNLKVRASSRSGANFRDRAIDIAQPTFDSSDTWLASVLVHEAIHFWQYRSHHYEAGAVAETEANRYQLGVLQSLGAPQGEIAYMLSQDGGHADLNGDGVYDWRDYRQRNY